MLTVHFYAPEKPALSGFLLSQGSVFTERPYLLWQSVLRGSNKDTLVERTSALFLQLPVFQWIISLSQFPVPFILTGHYMDQRGHPCRNLRLLSKAQLCKKLGSHLEGYQYHVLHSTTFRLFLEAEEYFLEYLSWS